MTNQTLITTIDELGRLKAQIADLARKEDELKERLADLEAGAYEGQLFRLAISESVRETLDMKAVREKLSTQFIRAHTRETQVKAYRVSARNNVNV